MHWSAVARSEALKRRLSISLPRQSPARERETAGGIQESISAELVNEVGHAARGPSEPISLHHAQFVTSTNELKNGGKFVAALQGFATCLLGADYLAPEGPQAFDLYRGVVIS
jgi:hypothetical protein